MGEDDGEGEEEKYERKEEKTMKRMTCAVAEKHNPIETEKGLWRILQPSKISCRGDTAVTTGRR